MGKKQAEPKTIVEYWIGEIKAARKREERYRKTGKEVFELYEADQEQETPFNILYSNTETLRPALYSAQPRPSVQRRFKDADPLGKLAADASRRMLEYHLDTNREDYETLNEAMGAIVLDTLLPGRGVIRLNYDADFRPIAEPRPPDEQDDDPVNTERAEYAENEQVCYESVVWDKVYLGYAKKWTKIPWIAYEFHLTKEEVATKFGDTVAKKLTYQSSQEGEADHESASTSRAREEDLGARRTACIYQIWDKAGGKKVLHVSPNYKDDLLKSEDDPLGLTGFFNTPRPLMFVEKSCSLIPTAPYKMYKSQADELNRLTRRIKSITEAIKARGIYDGSMGGDLEKLMEKSDNALVPAEVSSILSTEKGFQSAIWFLPIDILIAVLHQLYQAREGCKQTIYEINGVADIMRGSTNASETLGAQRIKNSWGTLRLKRMQNEVARYVRDLLRMTQEIAGSHFSEETWAQMTNLPFVTTAQRQQLEQQAAMMQMAQAQGSPIDPQAQAQLQAQLQQPAWGQVLQLLKDDNLRSYRIDIETNSTVQPEAAEDMQAMQELLQALGAYFQAVSPLIMQGVMPWPAAKDMMMAIARMTRFGPQVEDSLNQMQPPKPQDDGKAKDAAMAQKELDMNKNLAMKEIQGQQREAEMGIKEKDMQHKMDVQQREGDLALREMALQVKEHQFEMQQNVERGMLDINKQHANQELDQRKQIQAMKEQKYSTENVVNKKTDTALNSVTKAVQAVQSLGENLKAVQEQADATQQLLQELIRATTAKRIKRPIRGKDGRIERVEEEVAA